MYDILLVLHVVDFLNPSFIRLFSVQMINGKKRETMLEILNSDK